MRHSPVLHFELYTICGGWLTLPARTYSGPRSAGGTQGRWGTAADYLWWTAQTGRTQTRQRSPRADA